ncbi:MAG: Cyclic di-GMP phosphodiesterase response regulator RpfG [Planctomycetota bacterium]
MTLATRHALTRLHESLGELDAVLVPVDPSVPDPFPPGPATDVLRSLCHSPAARGAVARAAARWTVGAATPVEPRPGLLVVPARIPRALAGGRFAAVTILAEGVEDDLILHLAQSARIDAGIARSILRARRLRGRAETARFASTVRILSRDEGELLSSKSASEQLGVAWEELHLLHSLSAEMAVGVAPRLFVERTLSEVRRTIGCGWVAFRVHGAAASLLGLEDGAVVGDGAELAGARRILEESARGDGRAAPCVTQEFVLSPVQREEVVLGLLAAGDREGGDGAMSSVERTLVESAAGHLAVFLDNARLYRDLDAMFVGAMSALVSAIDAKDPYTRGHSQRVALLSRRIAESLGLKAADLRSIYIAGLVHDVGKIGVPEEILRKEGRLSDGEFEAIKRHPEIGWRILRDIPQFAPVLDGVRYHHERFDGRGYPHGLAGRDIPLFARIIAVADTFDAMSSNRVYRAARPRDEVFAEMRRVSGQQFDPEILAAFLALDLAGYDEMNAAPEPAFAGADDIRFRDDASRDDVSADGRGDEVETHGILRATRRDRREGWGKAA